MDFHVGIYPLIGLASIYNSSNKEVSEVEIQWKPDLLAIGTNRTIIDPIRKIYETIKSKIEGTLGSVSIVLEKHDNFIRKTFILCGTKAGFKKVEIIDSQTAIYLHATFYSEYVPRNDDVIWINFMSIWHVWEKKNNKAKYIGSFIKDSFSKDDCINLPFEKYPNVILRPPINQIINSLKSWPSEFKLQQYEYQTFIDYTSLFQRLFRNSPEKSNHTFKRGPLVHAQLIADNHEMIEYHVERMSDRRITVKMADAEVTTFQSLKQLPSKCFITFKSQQKYNELIIESEQKNSSHISHLLRTTLTNIGEKLIQTNLKFLKEETIPLPPYDNLFLTFSIDCNGIYTLNVQELSPQIFANIDEFMDVYYGTAVVDNLSIVKTQEESSKRYVIPKRIFTNDERINAIGIDLGTTRCCVAVNRKNGIQTAPLDNTGERLLPSYVSYDESHVKCGNEVVKRMQHFSKSTVFDSKRLLGKSFKTLKMDDSWTFDVVEENDKIFIQVQGCNKKLTMAPEEISGDLLKYIKKQVKEYQGKELTEVVITVPAAFNDAQNEATLKAAYFAGWKTVHLLPEPVAAAFAYFVDRPLPDNSILLLLDLGGGTLDVCIFKVVKNQIEIVNRSGDPNFGGRDFDNVLMSYFKERLENDFKVNISKKQHYKLMQKCQEIKHDLTVSKEYKLDVDDFDTSKEDSNIAITQDQFYELSKNLLEKLKTNIDEALSKAGYKGREIDKVLYVGGGCRMLKVKELIREIFPHAEHCCEQHPDEVVASGAAYYSYYLNCKENYTDEELKIVHFKNFPKLPMGYSMSSPSFLIDNSINIVGIDLGTTTCSAAVNRNNGFESIFQDFETILFPSFVAYDDESPKCGSVAINRLRFHSKSTVFDIKKILGKKIENICEEDDWTFALTNVNNKVKIKLQRNGKEIFLHPEEIYAELLKDIKKQTEMFQGKELTEAAITVPLTYDDAQNDAVRAAALLAGWKKVYLLPEPVAAIITYLGNSPMDNSILLVFDLGGGNLDNSLFRIQNNQLQLLNSKSDPNICVKDFDNLLVEYFKQKLINEYKINITKKKYQLRQKCEGIKWNLSRWDEDSLEVDDFDPALEGNIKISRIQYENMAVEILNRIRGNCKQLLLESKVTSNQIDKVIHVGGGCRMPMIKKLLKDMYPESAHLCYESLEEVVAIGAANYVYYFKKCLPKHEKQVKSCSIM